MQALGQISVIRLLLPIELLGPDFCYHKSYVCRIAVTYGVIGARFLLSYGICMQDCCYLWSYWGQISVIMQDCCYLFSYWGQISVILWVIYAVLLLPIELLHGARVMLS